MGTDGSPLFGPTSILPLRGFCCILVRQTPEGEGEASDGIRAHHSRHEAEVSPGNLGLESASDYHSPQVHTQADKTEYNNYRSVRNFDSQYGRDTPKKHESSHRRIQFTEDP